MQFFRDYFYPIIVTVIVVALFAIVIYIIIERDKELVARNPYNEGQVVTIILNGKDGVVKWKNSQTTCVRYVLSTGEVTQGYFSIRELKAKE